MNLEESLNVVMGVEVPEPIRCGVNQAVTATKDRLRQQIEQADPIRRPTAQAAEEFGRVEAMAALNPLRGQIGLTLTQWFTLFYGPNLGPLETETEQLERLYQRWCDDASYYNELQAMLDRLFEHIVDAVVNQIIADCRDDGLIYAEND